MRDYGRLAADWERLANEKGWQVKRLGKWPILKIQLKNNGRRCILLTAGLHGEEPAGAYALLEFLRKVEPDFSLDVFPCLNPWGFMNGKRKNREGLDLNREFSRKNAAEEVRLLKAELGQYFLAADLHEVDYKEAVPGFTKADNPKEFYLYENCPDHSLRAARQIINGINVPVCLWKTIYGDINSKGVVWYPEGRTGPIYKNAGTFDEYLLRCHTVQALTVETPTCWPLKMRVRAHMRALELMFQAISSRAS